MIMANTSHQNYGNSAKIAAKFTNKKNNFTHFLVPKHHKNPQKSPHSALNNRNETFFILKCSKILSVEKIGYTENPRLQHELKTTNGDKRLTLMVFAIR